MDNVSGELKYTFRPTWTEVDLTKLKNNACQIQKHIGLNKTIFAVVKADGYGHGSIQITQALYSQGVMFYCVASIEEAVVIRRPGINVPILILGTIFPYSTLPLVLEYNLTPTVSSEESFYELNKLTKKYGCSINVHLKIDTGMGRIGITPENVLPIIQRIKKSYLKINGIYTHFSSADSDVKYTEYQNGLFNKTVLNTEKVLGYKIRYIHAANSAAILQKKEYQHNSVRPGLLLYGLLPYENSDKIIHTEPILTWKTRVVHLKWIKPGKKVSYGGTYTTRKKTYIATLPVGYADGYSRLLSNKGNVLVKGIRAPVVGRVTMDMIMVDVTKIKNVCIGDEVR